MTTALITGILGQDGSYLAEQLTAHGYRVVGISRAANDAASASPMQVDITDLQSVIELISRWKPLEVYNFAGPSYKPVSYKDPYGTYQVVALGTANLLESIRRVRPEARFVQASSSEMFGHPEASPQDESTPLRPRNPYAAAKASAHHLVGMYRADFGLHASSAILFSHESPRRRETFVTRKISAAVARIKFGLQDCLVLGNRDASRDWGFAGDYVRAMSLMSQQDRGDDFVIGTGITHTVREFCEAAFAVAGIDECERLIRTDPDLVREEDPTQVVADPTKAKQKLGWEPSVSFDDLVRLMVEHDLNEQMKLLGGEAQSLT